MGLVIRILMILAAGILFALMSIAVLFFFGFQGGVGDLQFVAIIAGFTASLALFLLAVLSGWLRHGR